MRERVGDLDLERAAIFRVIGTALAVSPRLAMNKAEAAQSLGVSVEFFDQHVAPDLRTVRRGRRHLYPLAEMIYWLWRAAEGQADDIPHRRDGEPGSAGSSRIEADLDR